MRRKAAAVSMTAGRAFLILISTLLLAGCSDSRSRAIEALKRVKAETLRRDAATFYKDIFAVPRKTSVPLGEQSWSRTFSELHPMRITAYPDGFAFCLESKGDSESGLYIVPLGMDHAPAPTRWASYEKISEGIFWYSFKP